MRRALRAAAIVSAAACAASAVQLGSLTSAQATPANRTPPAGVVAAAAELVNATSGKWMWSRGLNTRHPIASLTKVMTAMVILSAGGLSRKIKVTEAAEQYAADNLAGSADCIPAIS
jgi:serine-type D-Ala-D-Ala carboxypeptidase (penicillin-binding protein 5/6)